MKWHIASVSWGKDSLAMLLTLIAKGYPLNEVVSTTPEWSSRRFTTRGIKCCPAWSSWGSSTPDWSRKTRSCLICWKGRFAVSRKAHTMVYVGIAADETPRLEKERKPYKLHPLAEWGMTEADALAYCYENGFSWLEGTIRLYDVLDRVSCWCCCNKNLRELRNMCIYLPEYWERLKDLQRKIDRPMKGYYKGQPRGVFELEQRFRAELEREAADDA